MKHAPVLLLLLASWLVDDAAFAMREPVSGQVTERVVCRQNSVQSYALYLPSNYTPARKWPILYALDAGARGVLPVQRFRAAAEEYGFIVAGSNNSRNGPLQIVQDAVNAMIADTESRFSLDLDRVYLAGFSGGARAAIMVGSALKGKVAGVIACGAGFPPSLPPTDSTPFDLFIAVGDEDFYFPELRALDRSLDGLGVGHTFESFAGGHEWPPEMVCTHALEWIELRAMRSQRRSMDASLVERICAKTIEEAAALEREQKSYEAYELYSAARDRFAGLRNVSAFESKVKQLEQSRAVRTALAREREAEARQRNTDAELSRLIDDVMGDRDRPFAMLKLRSGFDELRNDASQKKNEVDRLAALRVLTRLRILLNEEVALDFERRDYTAAALRLGLMSLIRPDNPQIYFHLARACCLAGKKKEALAAIRNAILKGYKDVEALKSNPDLESLRAEPDYQRIIQDMKKQPAPQNVPGH